MGCQPIFAENGSAYGYEYWFQNGFQSEKDIEEYNDDSAIHITEAQYHFMDAEIKDFVENKVLFVNLSEQTLLEHDESKFSPQQSVFEFLNPFHPTSEVIHHLSTLKQQGYRFALGTFIFKKDYHALLPIADFIKIDLSIIQSSKLPDVLEKIRRISQAKIIAFNVQDHPTANFCFQNGCEYVQGSYFLQPIPNQKGSPEIGRENLVTLLKNIVDEDVSIVDIEILILRDPVITHRILQLAQKYRTQHMPEFSSIKEIVMLFGLKRVQAWATEIALHELSDTPPEVFHQARIRSLFLRNAAIAKKSANEDSFAMAGVFSMLDAILNQPLEKALEQLPVNPSIKNSIIHETGELGALIKHAKQFEQFKANKMSATLKEIYLESIKEANHVAQAF